jgi:lysyl-tRNA synthetase class 2
MNWWRPDRFSKKRKNLEMRAKIFAALRIYFEKQAFVEVDVPALQVSPGLEPHLHAFETRYELPHGGEQKLYLHTSPEFTCKKLLAAGMERIYQLGHVFRNREGSSRHHPEFMMLEWYRAGGGTKDLMEDCVSLLHATLHAAGRDKFSCNGFMCDGFAEAEILTVQEAFQRHLGVDMLATIDNPLNPSPDKLALVAKKHAIYVAKDDRWDDIALRLMAEKIEPNLGIRQPCFLTDYPICMAALARPKPEAPHLAERFELYVCGLELANGFVELTDAKLQRSRFEADMDLKEKLYGYRLPLDEDFLTALSRMPQAAGIALGVDRLVMLAVVADDINDVIWAPVAGT